MDGSSLRQRPLYNSRIINSFILLIKQKYSYVNINDLLAQAGMKEYEVADQAHWFNQEQVDRFYDKLVQLTGNSRIAREAGRYAASPDVLGAMRQYILGLVDAASTFDIINKTTAKFTRSSTYQSRTLASNAVEIVVTPLAEGLERQYQCENRIGFFEAIVLLFNHQLSGLRYLPEIKRLPTIQHPECVFQGGKVCRYIISWEKATYVVLRKVEAVAGVFLVVFNLTLAILELWGWLAASLPASFCVYFILALFAEKGEKRTLKQSLDNTKEAMDNLLDQIDINYNNAMLTNEIGQALGALTRRGEMLDRVAGILGERLPYDRGVILLADEGRRRLQVGASYGYSEEQLACLCGFPFLLDGAQSPDVYVDVFLEQRPVLVNDLAKSGDALGERRLACVRMTGTVAFICCPIVSEGVSLGVLSVEQVKARKPLVERDISLVTGIASMIGISLRNCQLIGDLERAKEDLEQRVVERTQDLELSRRKLQLQHEELERTYFELEEETGQRLKALEDLAEKERLLLQQSRLAALGEMISNIAHQWRQPLNELGLIVQELPLVYDKGAFSRDYLRESVAKFMRLLSHTSKTIDDFRNFFKPDKARVPFSPRDLVEQTLSLVHDSFRHLDIVVEVSAEGEPVVTGHPNEFSQVILNLLFNARDAFLERQIEGRRIAIRIGSENGYAVVSVQDNAGGIGEEIIDKIFDPYFTTRGPEKGTGIGLYMSKIIIEKNIPGRLSVSNVDGGARFTIEIPLRP
ncbi:hypothetical protein GMSM_07440 [Geomonas sp. Red276]